MIGWRRTVADRQTIIALRATHTAHRVANDVSYPELPLPAHKEAGIFGERPIVDYEPRTVLNYHAGPMPWRVRHLLIWFVILLILAIAYHVFAPSY